MSFIHCMTTQCHIQSYIFIFIYIYIFILYTVHYIFLIFFYFPWILFYLYLLSLFLSVLYILYTYKSLLFTVYLLSTSTFSKEFIVLLSIVCFLYLALYTRLRTECAHSYFRHHKKPILWLHCRGKNIQNNTMKAHMHM